MGTHALKCNSGTSLWQRLSQHRGTAASGGGNHRGSIFRLLVGTAIKDRDALVEPRSWDVGSNPGAAAQSLGLTREQVLIGEQPLETAVSEYVHRMPFLWLAIDDMAGPKSDRGVIERNAIALSNYNKPAIDPPSTEWLDNIATENACDYQVCGITDTLMWSMTRSFSRSSSGTWRDRLLLNKFDWRSPLKSVKLRESSLQGSRTRATGICDGQANSPVGNPGI